MQFSTVLMTALAVFSAQAAAHPGLAKRQGGGICLQVCHDSPSDCPANQVVHQSGSCYTCCTPESGREIQEGERTQGAPTPPDDDDDDDEGN